MNKGSQTRQEIVGRALELAGDLGLEGVTMGVLASDLEMSKSGLFAHFKSKEALQLDVLHQAMDHFIKGVVLPALSEPRGEQRIRVLFDRYLAWIQGEGRGRCIFMALNQEYDDRPGPVRDLLVQSQRDWHETIARVAATAIDEGHFRRDLDAAQFAFEFSGIGMAFQYSFKLLAQSRAEEQARTAFTGLLERCRA